MYVLIDGEKDRIIMNIYVKPPSAFYIHFHKLSIPFFVTLECVANLLKSLTKLFLFHL